MKAITVQQPWAWAIMHGRKTIENRTQNWNYRGPLAIHAGNRWSDCGGNSDLVINAWIKHAGMDALKAAPLTEDGLDADQFTFGGILGVVDLVDVHPSSGCCKPWGESVNVVDAGPIPERHIVHLVLENPCPLAEPYPCRGALGLWTPPDDLVVPA